jgi:hypothetical protein
MRTIFQRVLTLAAAAPLAATALVVAAPAASAAAPICPAGTAVTEFDLLGSGHYRVAVYAPSSTQTILCLEVQSSYEAVLVLKTGAGVNPPNVTETEGIGTCATRIIDMTAPISLSLSVGASTTGPAVCFGKDGTTTTVSFNAGGVTGIPDVEVWFPDNTTLQEEYCYSRFYVLYIATESSSYLNQYSTCRMSDQQAI